MTPGQLAAGLRWADWYHRHHPRARSERDRWADFDLVEAAIEAERDRDL